MDLITRRGWDIHGNSHPARCRRQRAMCSNIADSKITDALKVDDGIKVNLDNYCFGGWYKVTIKQL